MIDRIKNSSHNKIIKTHSSAHLCANLCITLLARELKKKEERIIIEKYKTEETRLTGSSLRAL